MTAKIIANSGNGNIEFDSIASFSYSEDASSIDPSNLTGGTSDISITAEATNDSIISHTANSSKLLIGNDITIATDTIGDVKFTATAVTVANGIVSVSGPTIQRRLNSIKTAQPFSGSLKGAIDYYCSLVDITPAYHDPYGNFVTQLEAVDVNFIGWVGNVWDKLKELVAHQVAVAPGEISPGFSDGTYHIEMFVDTVNNHLKFRRAFYYEDKVNLDEVLTDESFSVDMNTTAKSVAITGSMTSLLVDDAPKYTYLFDGKLSTPIYELSFYEADADANVAFKSSIDTSGLSISAGEKIERLYQMDTHPLNGTLATPVCVGTISRVPYRKARGDMIGYQYVPNVVNDIPQTNGTIRIYCASEGYENMPGVGEQVYYDSFTMSGGYTFNAKPIVKASSQTGNWFELDVIFTALASTQSGAISTGKMFETPYASGEFVVVGDGDIPIDPDEWRGLGGKLTVEQTEIPGQIKVSITAPTADEIVSADDPDVLVNGPFRIGIEVADDGEYPAFWLLASGVRTEPKSVTYVTGVDVTPSTVDQAPAVESVFITDEQKLHSAALFAAQSACGPKVSMSRSIDIGSVNGKITGNTYDYDGAVYRIESASYSDASATFTARPYLRFEDFTNAYYTGSVSFDEFNTGAAGMTFAEFSISPLVGAL